MISSDMLQACNSAVARRRNLGEPSCKSTSALSHKPSTYMEQQTLNNKISNVISRASVCISNMHACPEFDSSCSVICDSLVRAGYALPEEVEESANRLRLRAQKYQCWFLYNQLGDNVQLLQIHQAHKTNSTFGP